ncbi:MAG: exosortase E/protease, VPEID-CTERM system [Gammaproteobacteria bacterium]|nr:exosortase E/protease, VPEID-CTERM system [Gammaproteobacteria bacterium]
MPNPRWYALAALLAAEVLVGINVLTVPELSGQTGLVAVVVGSAAQAFKVAVAFLATCLLILSRRLQAITATLRDQPGYRWWPWLLAHGLACGAFLFSSWPILGPASAGAVITARWLLTTLGLGILTLTFLLLAAAPAGRWMQIACNERLGLAVAAIAGFLAWLGGFLAQEIWLPLSRMTLWCTRQLLGLIYTDIYIDNERAILGAGDFAVQIAPECSGYEGMALITAFSAVYLWLFRADLRFPRALLLIPVGIVVIWLVNVLRVTALIAIGVSFSPDIAVTGFHSQAGWISFSIVALGLIALSHRHLLLAGSGVPEVPAVAGAGAGPALALLAPLLTLLAASMLIAAFSSGFAALYPLGVIATAAVLWHFRAQYRSYARGLSWQAIAIGVAVFVLWIALAPPDEGNGVMLEMTLSGLPGWQAGAWLGFRVIGSVITVPIAEELAFRGYLLRKLVAGDFENVRPGQFTWLSFLASSLLFGVLHNSWVAGTLAGAGFALALYHRGRIVDAIVAHMTSNALVAVAVLAFGQWKLWA